ncbi:MAG: CPBP family glutamic-type intramembrane protease [Verrucomicrobiota bacterium]
MAQPFRILVGIAVVMTWLLLGLLLRLDPNSYLLAGIPLLVIFQLAIARRPLAQLWLRDAPAFELSPGGWVVAALFMIYPALSLVEDWRLGSWPVRIWEITATAGAVPLAFALSHANRRTWMNLLWCFLIAGTIGCAEMLLVSMHRHHGLHLPPRTGTVFLTNFLLYLPVCFMIEEVFFRGGLDSYIQRDGDRFGWLTAPLVAALWGWWHLGAVPVRDAIGLVGLIIGLPLVHLIPGVTSSVFWRRSGNLLVPAAVHSFIDSFRNAVM